MTYTKRTNKVDEITAKLEQGVKDVFTSEKYIEYLTVMSRFHNYSALQQIAPVPVRFDKIEGGANGYFSFADHEIVINEGMSETQTIKTAVHEIAHAILHDKDTGEEKDADRNTKEVQAESVAYTVCQYLGIDTTSYSFEYVAGWSSDRDVKELLTSLDTIQKTARDIIDQIAA